MIDVRRAAERFTTRADGLESRHSFSFGPHYDPGNVGFAVLVAHNDDVVEPGRGYDTHPHRDTEIVTWVLEGSLVHEDSHGNAGVIRPGLAQRIERGPWRAALRAQRRARRRVDDTVRADVAAARRARARPVVPAARRLPRARHRGLLPVVSGVPDLDAAVRIHTSGAALHVARLGEGERVQLPDAPRLHLFVARGSMELEAAGRLDEGDAARLAVDGGPTVTAAEPTEVLVWQLPADVTGSARRG